MFVGRCIRWKYHKRQLWALLWGNGMAEKLTTGESDMFSLGIGKTTFWKCRHINTTDDNWWRMWLWKGLSPFMGADFNHHPLSFCSGGTTRVGLKIGHGSLCVQFFLFQSVSTVVHSCTQYKNSTDEHTKLAPILKSFSTWPSTSAWQSAYTDNDDL